MVFIQINSLTTSLKKFHICKLHTCSTKHEEGHWRHKIYKQEEGHWPLEFSKQEEGHWLQYISKQE